MCDTLLAAGGATAGGAVLFAKNSDREPGEAQRVEFHPRREHRRHSPLRCTWMSVPRAPVNWAIVLCRPFWMWGAEMGANEHGVVVGNQAVFTRLDVAPTGLTGMDLVRLALRRARTAREAVDVITGLIERYGQGGRCGYRHTDFRYHSSFGVADADEAWIVETADRFWAARRIREVWSLSNALTIREDFDRIADGAVEFAVERGWANSGEAFDFRAAFSSPVHDVLAGADRRRRCTIEQLVQRRGRLRWTDLAAVLRSHNGGEPTDGWRMTMPCAHAGWPPTRSSGQTVGSMVSRLDATPTHWLTGTSSPCLSVFKPVIVGEPVDVGPQPGGRFDEDSLFWRHELLHRRMITRGFEFAGGARRHLRQLRRETEAGARARPARSDCSSWWRRHRRAVRRWAADITPGPMRPGPSWLYWRYQNWIDAVPVYSHRGSDAASA